MATLPSSTGLQVESVVFPPSVKPPGTTNTLFLAGAGVRGLEIQGKFVKFSAIGVYLEYKAIPSLAVKWKGKTAAELTDSVEFYRDVVTGPFEKFAMVTMIQPLTGKQYSEKVFENCVRIWKAQGTYTDEDADATAIDKFLEVFKDQNFPPGSSILFTISPSLKVSFSKDGIIPEAANVEIESDKLGPTIIESMIGKDGVSPAAKQSLASRLSDLMKQFDENANGSFEA